MNVSKRTRKLLSIAKKLAGVLAVVCLVTAIMHVRSSAAQQPASHQASPAPTGPAAGTGRGAGGRGALPNATPAQRAAFTQMNTDLAPLTQALAAARSLVIATALAELPDDAAIRENVEAVRVAEMALATARADAFAKIQASPDKFSPDQIAAIARTTGGGRGIAGLGGAVAPKGPDITSDQGRAINSMNSGLATLTQDLQAARTALTTASLAEPRDDATIATKANAIRAAELALAEARSAAFSRLQHSPNKLDAEQAAAFIAVGGTFGGFGSPGTVDFDYHKGYVPLFDGVSLKGWDGNPKFWRVEDGAIVGQSTPTNPSGNTYIVCHAVQAHDFTLKLEIKVEGSGGSGIQYRSKTGIPWLTAIPDEVTANVGPVNLNWMLTGPQADFWPTNGADVFSGQFYVENDPMRIVAWRGDVVEGSGEGTHRVMGTIGDRASLGTLVKKNDWNQYTIIARGGTFIQIINGQLMSVMVDDDPKSVTNQAGLFGIEMEAVTKVSVRNIWLKKLN